MNGEAVMDSSQARGKPATWIGLFVSLFGMLIIRQVFRQISPEPGPGLVLLKEGITFAAAVFLLWLVRRWEGQPLRSIGLGTAPWWKSLLWGLVTAMVCAAVAAGLVALTGYGHGPGSAAFEKLPLGLITLVVLRSGIVEELFYRGYPIERLQALGLGRAPAVIIPLLIFAVGHWTGGAANILIAFVLGAILTAFYLWRRDLVSNMIGHFLVDFVANVLPRLAG
jgi:membrane protease YdiL (CAAX protease family)